MIKPQLTENTRGFTMIQQATQLLRPAQVCKQLAISSTTLWRLVKSNKLKAPIKISNRAVAFKSEDIENYINSITEGSNQRSVA